MTSEYLKKLNTINKIEQERRKGTIKPVEEDFLIPDPEFPTKEEKQELDDRIKILQSIQYYKEVLKNKIEDSEDSKRTFEKFSENLLKSVSKPLNSIKDEVGGLPEDGNNATPTLKEYFTILGLLSVPKEKIESIKSSIEKWDKTNQPVNTRDLKVFKQVIRTLSDISRGINVAEFSQEDQFEAQKLKETALEVEKFTENALMTVSQPKKRSSSAPETPQKRGRLEMVDIGSPTKSSQSTPSSPRPFIQELLTGQTKLRETTPSSSSRSSEEEGFLQRAFTEKFAKARGQEDDNNEPSPFDEEEDDPVLDTPAKNAGIEFLRGVPFLNFNRLSATNKDMLLNYYVNIKDLDLNRLKDTSTFQPNDNKQVRTLKSKVYNAILDKKKAEGMTQTMDGSGAKKLPWDTRSPLQLRNGQFGKLMIDMPKFRKYELVARKGKKVVAKGQMSADLHDLIGKRIKKDRTYNKDDVEVFRKLVKMAGLPMNESSYKGKMLTGRVKNYTKPKEEKVSKEFVYYNSPEELLSRLQIVLGGIDAGNTNKSLKTEAMQLAGLLKENKIFSEPQYISLVDSLT